MPRIVIVATMLILLSWSGGSIASRTDASDVGGIPQSVLRAEIPLRESLSRIHHPASTDSSIAQDFYDQGLTYYYTYGWIDAARSFNAALAHDPEFAMAWLGLARTYIELGNYSQADGDDEKTRNLARELARKAQGLRGTIQSRNELDLLDLLTELVDGKSFYRLDDDGKAGYRQKVAAAVSSHPRDVELLFLQAMVAPTERRSERFNELLVVAPDHVGAHHELVHHYEIEPGHVDRAVAHGNIMSRLAPRIAHVRHMYGHNLGRVGRMPEALVEFEAADDIELALSETEGISVEYDWHHQHNLIYLLRSNYHQRNLLRVEEVISRLRKQVASDPLQPPWGLLPAIDFYIARDAWGKAEPLIDELAKADDDAAKFVADLTGSLKLIAAGENGLAAQGIQSAARKFDSSGASLPDHLRFYRDLPTALLAVADGNASDIEALIDKNADDGGPYSWNDAHLRLDMMAALALKMNQVSLVEKIASTLQEHDPDYAGISEWRAKVAQAGRSSTDESRK